MSSGVVDRERQRDWRAEAAAMTTERAALLTDSTPASGEADPDLSPSDRPETDHPGAKLANPTAALSMRRSQNASAETQRLYAADWRAFEDWCRERSLVSLATDATTVAAFLTEGAKTLSAGALSRRASAIAQRHRLSGFPSPAADPAVTAILHAARRTATPRRPAPKPLATLIPMAVRCPRDLAGTRDRALLLLAANGLSRAALVGLDVEHIRFTTTAVELWLGGNVGRGARRTAGWGRGVPVVVRPSADRAVCPVQALRDWLATSETQFGPVFRKIDRWGTLEHHRLGTDAIRRILERRALRRTAKSHKALERTTG
jgi:site-specific recombinase XerC